MFSCARCSLADALQQRLRGAHGAAIAVEFFYRSLCYMAHNEPARLKRVAAGTKRPSSSLGSSSAGPQATAAAAPDTTTTRGGIDHSDVCGWLMTINLQGLARQPIASSDLGELAKLRLLFKSDQLSFLLSFLQEEDEDEAARSIFAKKQRSDSHRRDDDEDGAASGSV